MHCFNTEAVYNIKHETDNTYSFDGGAAPKKVYFDLKLKISGRILQNCPFCNRKGHIDRAAGKLVTV